MQKSLFQQWLTRNSQWRALRAAIGEVADQDAGAQESTMYDYCILNRGR